MRNRVGWMVLAAILAVFPAMAAAQPSGSHPRCILSGEPDWHPTPIWPHALTRIEVEVTQGIENVTQANDEIIENVEASERFAAMTGQVRPGILAEMLARRSGPAEPSEEGEIIPLPVPADGRYVILAMQFRHKPTGSFEEQAKACGSDEARIKAKWSNVGLYKSLIALRCEDDCGKITLETLIDRVYQSAKENQTYVLIGRERCMIHPPGQPGAARYFSVTNDDVLDIHKLTRMHGGWDFLAFHPERFEIVANVREMKSDVIEPWESLPLITRVASSTPCPDGDTSEACAPIETASRMARIAYQQGGCDNWARCYAVYRMEHSTWSWSWRWMGPVLGLIALLAMLAFFKMRERRRK